VLYFQNLSHDSGDVYLADGLTEEMIARLGRIDRLVVKSRTAVQRYRGRVIDDLAAVGRGLNVTHLVNGSVRRDGARLRLTVELVQAATGTHLWGEVYDRADTDLLGLETDIAQAVAVAIAGRLLPAESARLARHPTRNPLAYDLYLHGNHNLAQRTPAAVARAIGEYEAAARLDSTFAGAEARAAIAYALFPAIPWEYPGLSLDSVLALSAAAAARALRVDSASSEAWTARGFLLAALTGSSDSVHEAFERALALDPQNDEAWHLYGVVLWALGEDAAATAAMSRALEINPQRAVTLARMAEFYWRRRSYSEALQLLDSAVAIDPDYYLAYWDRALVRLHRGESGAARSDIAASVRLSAGDPLPLAALALVEAQTGNAVAARTALDRFWRAGRDSLRPLAADAVEVAYALVGLGEKDHAVEMLERVRDPWLWYWIYMRFPELDALQPDPRFQHLLATTRPGATR
jgi:TolB-like protein/Tfp pilus assembly protein PilF